MIAFSVVHRVYSKLLPSHCLRLLSTIVCPLYPSIIVCLLPLPLHHGLSPPTPSIIVCLLPLPPSSYVHFPCPFPHRLKSSLEWTNLTGMMTCITSTASRTSKRSPALHMRVCLTGPYAQCKCMCVHVSNVCGALHIHMYTDIHTHTHTHTHTHSLVPRPLRPAFVAYGMKSRGRPGRIYHMMRATADVTLSLLTSGLVLSPSLLSLNSVCSFCSVCPVSPIATGSIVASYST